MPGAIFHLTARTVRGERWLTPALRTRALRVVAEVVPGSASRLLSVAIMSNHLHLVVQQGERPLSRLMQPILRRLALLVQRTHGLEGPVFWRHYASQPCADPSYARNAIVYTHLNPVRAGLCSRPSGYPWTSHTLYAEGASNLPGELEPIGLVLDTAYALPLFATGADRCAAELRDDYRAFVDWRLGIDPPTGSDDPEHGPSVPVPEFARSWADSRWASSLSPLFHSPIVGNGDRIADQPYRCGPDMATIAGNTLTFEGSSLSLDQIRGRLGGREASRMRHAIIRRLHAAGYQNVRIAEFLRISASAVSYALCTRARE